ncbi:hypothetical protein ABIB50_000081 [Mucilaginibacter sp. UYCu711]
MLINLIIMSNLKSNQNITPFLWFDGKAEEAM